MFIEEHYNACHLAEVCVLSPFLQFRIWPTHIDLTQIKNKRQENKWGPGECLGVVPKRKELVERLGKQKQRETHRQHVRQSRLRLLKNYKLS